MACEVVILCRLKFRQNPLKNCEMETQMFPVVCQLELFGRGGSQQLLTFTRKRIDISPNISNFTARKWHPLMWFDRWYVWDQNIPGSDSFLVSMTVWSLWQWEWVGVSALGSVWTCAQLFHSLARALLFYTNNMNTNIRLIDSNRVYLVYQFKYRYLIYESEWGAHIYLSIKIQTSKSIQIEFSDSGDQFKYMYLIYDSKWGIYI